METSAKVTLGILIGIVLYVVVGRTIELIIAYQSEGQWETFDSNSEAHPPQDPDGYRLEYPVSWNAFFHSGGGTKNLREQRGHFESPYYWWVSKTYLSIWWRRIDDNWTLPDALSWFEHELAFGIRDSEVKSKHHSWEQAIVGKGKYPALMQTFRDTFAPYRLQRSKETERVVLFIVGDEVFVLTFYDDEVDPETTAIFQRMLDSFDVYK